MVKDVLKALEGKMKVSADHFRKDLSKVRTGRANLSLFEDIKVEYYGTLTPAHQMAKKIKKMLEDEKTALRNMRRESKEQIEALEKDKKITEDDKFNGLELLQKIIDDYSKKIEETAAVKEKEILESSAL